jgi:hypothetical protein
MEGITDDKQRIKENLKKIKEKLIQRINQMEYELTNKLDTLVQENTQFQQDEISKVIVAIEEVELCLKEMLFIVEHGSSPNILMDGNKTFDSSMESVTRFSCDAVVCNSLSA